MSEKEKGVVKWFDEKGYGLLPSVGGDVFVHYSDIVGQAGFRSLKEGDNVEFTIKQNQKDRQPRTSRRFSGFRSEHRHIHTGPFPPLPSPAYGNIVTMKRFTGSRCRARLPVELRIKRERERSCFRSKTAWLRVTRQSGHGH